MNAKIYLTKRQAEIFSVWCIEHYEPCVELTGQKLTSCIWFNGDNEFIAEFNEGAEWYILENCNETYVTSQIKDFYEKSQPVNTAGLAIDAVVEACGDYGRAFSLLSRLDYYKADIQTLSNLLYLRMNSE